jgi:hypothetical protein
MQITLIKAVLAALWLLTVIALGAFMPVTTITGWVTILGFGLVPAVLMLRAWRQPQQTISDIIHAEIDKK